jgi:transcriptional regulator with XRE-family HTH domain
MSQNDIAKKLGVKQAAISQWESGIREPSLEMIVQLAEAFGVTVMAFLEPGSSKRGRPPKAEPPAKPKRKGSKS